ncbi:sensor histidine kinase [Promicromonospora panici]|uniref:sensor histidine kinase n=1 Tax=Promicromonospora panici TaxID=2219658 RepID=UPI0013EBBD2C|nr:histidine kinase [Promicromonospora panici]
MAVLTFRRATPLGAVSALVGWHRRRTVRFLGWADDGAALTSSRAAGYLVMRVGVGLVGVLVLALLAYGLFAVVAAVASWLFDVRLTVLDPDQGDGLTTPEVLAMVPLGAVLLYLDLMGLVGVGVLDRAAAARWLSPSRSERLEAQVESLTVSRAELLAALDAERGRIERDLHDGVQQRAVALGLLVNRARRGVGPDSSGALLLEQAAREAELLVTDLRDVAWRVRPTTLDTHGLAPVLAELVSRSGVPASLEWDSPERLPAAVETTVYYVVAEALTNVAKHSGAQKTKVRIHVGRACRDLSDPTVHVTITDDGVGGAVQRPGHGLAGLSGRVAAAGGTLAVESPAGGPTRIEVTLPCE